MTKLRTLVIHLALLKLSPKRAATRSLKPTKETTSAKRKGNNILGDNSKRFCGLLDIASRFRCSARLKTLQSSR
jgi:hypothetical protein